MTAPDTIAALATARGEAALAIVRLSGVRAREIAQSRFSNCRLADAPSHTAHVGWVTDARGQRVDQAVATLFRGPTSATGEDVVELTTHGGSAAPQAVLRAMLDAGARLAEPGEFTQRAFLAGKLDLAQAEAVADLIHAHSTAAARAAARGIEGRTSGALAAIKDRLIETAALVELELDFSDEDVEFADRSTLARLLAEASGEIEALLSTARLGALVRDGVRVVIGGRPNAGKSTLLNALVEHDRAIVSDVPGTTRDSVEAEREVGGLLFRFVDTAGLRETEDAIEAEGVRRSRAAASGADVLLYVHDARAGLDAPEAAFLRDLAGRRPDLPILHVANKTDLLSAETPEASGGGGREKGEGRRGTWNGKTSMGPQAKSPLPPGEGQGEGRGGSEPPEASGDPAYGRPGGSPLLDAVPLSAQEALTDPAALDGLRQRLLDAVRAGETDPEGGVLVTNERHRQLLVQAREAVARARAQLASGADGDLLALDLRAALDALGRITGAVTADDVLGAVFGRFCIGK